MSKRAADDAAAAQVCGSHGGRAKIRFSPWCEMEQIRVKERRGGWREPEFGEEISLKGAIKGLIRLTGS